ncbi:hypothetical protein [Bythopirellula polymerisocia]|uniref:Uncharacterized protein n=1 Tax=Bythopirellula polymerisocia TaxID=2528003 RepID=A0A5C6CF27_9BACT|nr:hypothetical protein [Bythopirellula polymerisocia]TWU21409.1 hypothetical protein Pla144_46300 [Bythopirellula polymerisocia]
MTQHQPTHKPEPAPQDENALTDQQARELADKAKQEEYRKAHLAQLRQLQCPGCGETELF